MNFSMKKCKNQERKVTDVHWICTIVFEKWKKWKKSFACGPKGTEFRDGVFESKTFFWSCDFFEV